MGGQVGSSPQFQTAAQLLHVLAPPSPAELSPALGVAWGFPGERGWSQACPGAGSQELVSGAGALREGRLGTKFRFWKPVNQESLAAGGRDGREEIQPSPLSQGYIQKRGDLGASVKRRGRTPGQGEPGVGRFPPYLWY